MTSSITLPLAAAPIPSALTMNTEIEHSAKRTQRLVDRYWRTHQPRVDLRPQNLLDCRTQSKIEEWKEIYFFQHQRLAAKQAYARRESRTLAQDENGSSANDDVAQWLEYLEWICDEAYSMRNERPAPQ